MTLAEVILAQINKRCLTKQCREGKCSVSLAGVSGDNALIHLESDWAPIQQDIPHCDFLFVGEIEPGRDEWVVPVELTGSKRASQLLGQLRTGAKVADQLVPNRAKVRFRPVLASNKVPKIVGMDLKKKANRVRFRGKDEYVIRIRCGEPLTKALRS